MTGAHFSQHKFVSGCEKGAHSKHSSVAFSPDRHITKMESTSLDREPEETPSSSSVKERWASSITLGSSQPGMWQQTREKTARLWSKVMAWYFLEAGMSSPREIGGTEAPALSSWAVARWGKGNGIIFVSHRRHGQQLWHRAHVTHFLVRHQHRCRWMPGRMCSCSSYFRTFSSSRLWRSMFPPAQ